VLVFGFARLFNNIGARGQHSVVSVGHYNYGVSGQGVWRTDGATVEYIDEPAVRAVIQDHFQEYPDSEVVAFHDEQSQMVCFYFDSTENYEGFGYNYNNGAWTVFNQRIRAASARHVFRSAIVAFDSGLYRHDEGHGSNRCYFQTKPLDLGAPERFKLIRALRFGFKSFRADGKSDLSVQVGFSELYRQKYIFTNEPVYEVKDVLYLEERECGWLSLRFSTEQKQRFQLNSIVVEGKVLGSVI